LPEPLESRRIAGRVLDGVLDVAVSEIILNQPSVRALVSEGEAASVAQHVGMSTEGQDGVTVFLQQQIDGRPVQRSALFTHKERLHRGPAPSSVHVPSARH